MEHRNRASGWKHAKRSGHKNEDLVKNLLDIDKQYASDFLGRIGCYGLTLTHTSVGGIHETNVESVIPSARKTKSKTDLKLFYDNGKQTNISIKKSTGGQVYFVRAGLFVECFERQFNKIVPKNVVRAINLFWAAADDAVDIIKQYGDHSASKAYALQIRHKSLNATTLKAYDKTLYDALLQWFIDNMYELTFLSFASGAVKDKAEWSEYIWYINMLDENDINEIFHIKKICRAASSVAKEKTHYGESNGGTTIQLPFGFVQWHQAKLQFHHDFKKISALIHR